MTPRLPSDSSAPRRKQPTGSTWLAMTFLVGAVIGFVALTSMILPQVGGAILVAAAFSGFVALHYFTWGRWLIAYHARQEGPDDV